MNARKPWSGVASVVRFNWPYYAAAFFAAIVAAVTLLLAANLLIRIGALLTILGSGYFIVVSIGVSYLVYDRSDLYRWQWLKLLQLPKSINTAICCYTGFDDCSESLSDQLAAKNWIVLDHYDPKTMTEASIHRARLLYPPASHALACPFDRWPNETPQAQTIIGMLAIHELRTEAQRIDWFLEAKKHLKPDGSIIIVEHTRNLANFIAFGPGFLHFHSRVTWKKTWTSAHFTCCHEFSITPWISVFHLIPT